MPTRGGSPARCCFGGGSELGLLPRLCDTASQEKGVLFGPYQRGPLSMDEGSNSVRRKVEVKGAFARGRARYWVGENVTDLFCERP